MTTTSNAGRPTTKPPCLIEGCDRVTFSRGMCSYHYNKQRQAAKGPCSVDGCERVVQAKGLCQWHYERRDGADTCVFEGCGRPVKSRKLCSGHYQQAVAGKPLVPIEERKTADEVADRRAAILAIAQRAQPTNARFIYYRATAEGLVPKTKDGYHIVTDDLKFLRKSDQLPYEWIRDNTRSVQERAQWDNVTDRLAVARYYRRNPWQDVDTRVEVWVESESAASVIYGEAVSRRGVAMFPTKGNPSITFLWAAAQAYEDDDRPVVIYYVGDHDPAGLHIPTKVLFELREYSGRDDITLVRLAVTPEQIDTLQLQGTTAKDTKWHNSLTGVTHRFEGLAYEVEAIDAPELRRIVAEALDSHLTPEIMAEHERIEAEERQRLQEIIDAA